ncbi:hypothetical protein PAEPH01_2030 [Pancytospora epiphaga]|nr:hypothetical protein PAEPH01_2030 [Pancytospora epiphaga]
MYGRKLLTRIDAKYKDKWQMEGDNPPEAIQARAKPLSDKYQTGYGKLGKSKDDLQILDKVLYADLAQSTSKLDPKWPVEATVIKVLYDSYKIQTPDGKIFTTNKKHVRPLKVFLTDDSSQKGGECWEHS